MDKTYKYINEPTGLSLKFLFEELINLQYEPAVEASKSNARNAYYYDYDQKAFWSFDDPLSLKVLNEQRSQHLNIMRLGFKYLLKLKNKNILHPSFYIHPKTRGGTVIFPSYDSLTAVVLKDSCVYKVSKGDNNVNKRIYHEVVAFQHAPSLCPEIYDYCISDDKSAVDYIITDYVSNNKPIKWKEWPTVLRSLEASLIEFYQSYGIEIVTVTKYFLDLCSKIKKNKGDFSDSTFISLSEDLLDKLVFIVTSCLEKYKGINTIALTQTHGDITPDNVRRSKRGLYLIDWGNAGKRNIFYDLFIQEYHRKNSLFWRLFPASNLEEYKPFFYGWSNSFLSNSAILSSGPLTAELFNICILLCFIEKVLLLIKKHKYQDDVVNLSSIEHVSSLLLSSQYLKKYFTSEVA